MIIVKCNKSIGCNTVVNCEISCKNEKELQQVIDWVMEENAKTFPLWSLTIKEINILPEPWVCQYCGQVIENDKDKRYKEDGEHICRECLEDEKKWAALFEGDGEDD